jgi:phosphonate transport system substrate-binding protein
MRLAVVLLTILLSFSAYARPLKIGKLVEERLQGMQNLKRIAELIISEMPEFDSYEIITEPTEDIDNFVSMIDRENVDIVIESIHTAAYAEKHTDMQPLLLISRNGSVFVKGIILVRKDSDIFSLRDLNGKTISLPNENATSTYHLIKNSFAKTGIKMTKIDSPDIKVGENAIGYTVTKDKAKSVNQVYLKKTDAAAICSSSWGDPNTVPNFEKEELKIIYETESVPGLFMLVRGSLPKETKEKIASVLLSSSSGGISPNRIKDCSITSFHKINFDWHSLLKTLD